MPARILKYAYNAGRTQQMVQVYGPDPNLNSALANAITIAKKASTPKNVIEQAIARGQGRSLSGVALESMKFEVMMGSNAFILDVETDNKLRALQDVGGVIRKHKGRTSATEFFFSRLGRVVFERHDAVGLDEIMDEAIELGAEDLEADEEGNMIVWSPPAQTMQIAQGIAKKFELKILNSEIIWSPNEETKSTVDSVEDVKKLSEFVDALVELPEVQAIYTNATKGESIPEENWADFEDNVDS
ncbi:putative transcriptional regulatory protein C8D2.12c [Cytospora mali]|uniref:Transcriptional regulatory protein C8D2.12c n=1 Tax=Cytospora mali TaxID=578113 RepID=A0A194VL88_CYTMA|nr:putative transcriptional regulatory protein C8D2.12c [Valsa mali]